MTLVDVSALPQPCPKCDGPDEFCCAYSRLRAETAQAQSFASLKDVELLHTRVLKLEKDLAFAHRLLLEAKTPLLAIGHTSRCAFVQSCLPGSRAACDCGASEVEFLLTRFDLALEG